jgi:hypothetical protein
MEQQLMTNPNVVIIMAKCSKTKENFGIRLEEKLSGQWVADWTFRMKAATAQREGYDQSRISGSFDIDDAYPGCPYCQDSGFVLCNGSLFSHCSKVSCGSGSTHTCPWCNQTAKIGGKIQSLNTEQDL